MTMKVTVIGTSAAINWNGCFAKIMESGITITTKPIVRAHPCQVIGIPDPNP